MPGYSSAAGARDLLDSVRSVRVSRSYSAGPANLQQAAADVSSMLNGREKEKRDMLFPR